MTSDDRWSHLLANCDASQQLAVTAADRCVLVHAGAGSGKTRVLTRRVAWRIAHGEADVNHVLVATFTRKAAAELRQRLGALGADGPITAGTFHAIALGELRRLALDRDRSLPAVLDRRARLVEHVLTKTRSGHRSQHVESVTGEIDWAKAQLIRPEDYVESARVAGRTTPLRPEEIATAYGGYEEEKRRRRVLDFDDLLTVLTNEIADDPDLAAAQRWRFRHFFVDELQDLTAAQLGLLEAWLGDRDDLFAVGDPDQSIYRWSGALGEAMTELRRRHPGAKVLRLEANYRSSPEVVGFSRAVFGARQPILSFSESGPRPSLRAYESSDDEASAIARSLQRAISGGFAARDAAVLARTNAQLRMIERALDAVGVPRRISVFELLRDPTVGAAIRRLRTSASAARLAKGLDELESSTATPSGSTRHLSVLISLGRDYLRSDPHGTGEGLGTYIQQNATLEPAVEEADAVEVLTFHRAKGLEWPTVYVVGLEDGYCPIAHARDEIAREEERRLLYVALSRAGRELHCSWAMRRRFGEHEMERTRSPFVDDVLALVPADEGDPAEHASSAAAEALAASRAHLRRAGNRRPPSSKARARPYS